MSVNSGEKVLILPCVWAAGLIVLLAGGGAGLAL